MRQPSPPSVGVHELPVEVLTMILEELKWRDILRARMVCKVFHEVSKMRSIWLNLCRPHLSSTAAAPQALHPERPIELYTSHELEFLFLRLKSADVGWRTEENPPARKREIEKTTPAKCIYLVEGGRWLLTASVTGCITYFDLDSSTLSENALIPDQFDPLSPDRFDPRADIRVVMVIDRDNDSAFLEFNLAVSFCLMNNPPPDPKAQSVQIWKVKLVLNDQQRGIGLTAEHLASFPLQPSVNGIFCLSLRGPHVALTLLSDQHQDSHLTFIIDWQEADGDQMDYPRRLLHPPYGKEPEAIHLLPGNKLFTVAFEGVMIFDYISIPETNSLPAVDFTDATVTPLWRVRGLGLDFNLRSSSISKPFFCSHSIRFSLRGKDSIHGIIIDYPYHEGPIDSLGQVVTLMEKLDVRMRSYQYYGYNKATVFAGHAGTYFYNYPWPDEQNDDALPVSLHTEGTFRACEFGPFLDESSGRVVVPSAAPSKAKCSHDKIDIWDFSLLYRCPASPSYVNV